jgi:hypothetical protein
MNVEDASILEEWRDIVLCIGVALDRIDALMVCVGCKTRPELMDWLAGRGILSNGASPITRRYIARVMKQTQ